jgi:hypothetical protein
MAILPTGSSERDQWKYYQGSYGTSGGFTGDLGYPPTQKEKIITITNRDRLVKIKLNRKKDVQETRSGFVKRVMQSIYGRFWSKKKVKISNERSRIL